MMLWLKHWKSVCRYRIALIQSTLELVYLSMPMLHSLKIISKVILILEKYRLLGRLIRISYYSKPIAYGIYFLLETVHILF